MPPLYQPDLAYIHATAFEDLARGADGEIVRRLRASERRIRRVLDVGCGAGPLTAALVNAGFDVTGIDISGDLLELARARVPQASFLQVSAYEAELRGYDAIVALGEVMAYHAEVASAEDGVGRFFERAAAALAPGGMLIFDVIGRGEPSLAGRTWKSGDDWAVLVETTENQDTRTVVRNIQTFRRFGDSYRRGFEVHTLRLFDVRSLCDRLASCGFVTETAPSYGDQPLPPRRHAFFATRRAEAGP
jgi:SAM-dependent methyltransferase